MPEEVTSTEEIPLTVELLPCPFCLKPVTAREIKGAGYSLVGCDDPLCVASCISALPVDWNTRTVRATAPLDAEMPDREYWEAFVIEADRYFKKPRNGPPEPPNTRRTYALVKAYMGHARPADWQPIESPPPVRQECLLLTVEKCNQSTTWKVATGYRNESGWWLWWNGQHLKDAEVRPTHWMPLPEPPALAASSSTEGDR